MQHRAEMSLKQSEDQKRHPPKMVKHIQTIRRQRVKIGKNYIYLDRSERETFGFGL